MKILRCAIRRKGYKDVFFNASDPMGGIRGGMIELGTSSIVGREKGKVGRYRAESGALQSGSGSGCC